MELVLSEKYQPLFEILTGEYPEIDTVVITGGRNSQKSFAVGTWSCVGAKDLSYNILYTRYTLTSAEHSIIPEFQEKIDILNAHTSFNVNKDRIDGVNGSKIIFKGIKTSSGNQTAALKSLKGFNVFVLEEAEEMPDFDSWDKIKKSIRSNTKQNINILILNPTTKTHWIYTEFFEDKGVSEGWNGIKDNVMYIHSTYLDMDRYLIADNLWVDFEDKRMAYEKWMQLHPSEMEHSPLRKKAKYYKHVIMGGWLEKSEGVIFENWEIGEFKETELMRWGNDYGFSNDPTTLVHVSIDKGNELIYLKEELYRTKMTTDDVANVMFNRCGSDLIVGDSAEPRLISELQNKGLNVIPAVKGKDSVKSGIALLSNFKLIVDPSSTNLIKELNNYSWSDKKSETPIDAHNHLIDAIRYAVTHALDDKGVDLEIDFF